jgi:hypothetical protein
MTPTVETKQVTAVDTTVTTTFTFTAAQLLALVASDAELRNVRMTDGDNEPVHDGLRIIITTYIRRERTE